jgi:hypothetical protein
MNRDPLNRTDWRLIAICVAVVAGSLFIVFNWFTAAFPEASIEFKFDRESSLPVAAALLRDLHVNASGAKHTATFTTDDDARIFLERSIGLQHTREVTKRDVRLWSWHHRWFKPLQVEEWGVDVAPTGEIIGYSDKLLDEDRVPDVDAATARTIAENFVQNVGRASARQITDVGRASARQIAGVGPASARQTVDNSRAEARPTSLVLVSTSERRLPHRTQRIYTWESQSVHPGGAPYRTIVTVDGNRVTSFSQRLHVPDAWNRSYSDLRSKNALAANVDTVFLIITVICIVIVFVDRLRRGDVPINTLLGFAAVAFILTICTGLNSFPLALADYDTTQSYSLFLARFAILEVILPAFGETMFLIVLIGAGEALYRERFPKQLAIPRLWNARALTSKRVFRSFVIGYALVAFFLAYQVAFYLIAGKFGAWSPAEVPYDSMLNTRFPWIAVLFAGFFPAMREEFMSRAFSIPFFERVMRSRVAAVIAAAFIWGFGHAMYANQPFYIRGVEVGIAGVLIETLLYRFGLLPLLIWHYTVDALYTALLMFRSGNNYYVISAALSSCVFFIPMVASVVLYIRNKGFVPDEDLDNSTIPSAPAPPATERVQTPLPAPIPVTRPFVITCVAAVVIAALLIAVSPVSLNDVADYRTTREQAVALSSKWMTAQQQRPLAKSAAAPVEGFRNWNRDSGAEDGGSPDTFDNTAAEYLLRHGLSLGQVVDLMRTRVQAATWIVRTYTPQQKREYRTELDPRTSRVIGYHRLQEERAIGARLEKEDALALARAAFPTYALDSNAFDLKEALNYQQPNRRDWLFHFDERKPLAADAWRRISVRVAGSEVTQFATTIKIPDEERRKADEQTALNFILVGFQIGGLLTILSLVVAGLVMATRRGNFPWREALRWTAVFAVIPLWKAFVSYDVSSFSYNTVYEWSTFIASTSINIIKTFALESGALFLAFAAIKAVYPYALDLHHRDARARFGRSAALAAIAAVAIFIARGLAFDWLAVHLPSVLRIHGVDVPQEVAIPVPAALAIGSSLARGIELSAVLALFVYAVSPLRRRPWIAPLIGTLSIFFMQFDASVDAHQLPLMLLGSATFAITIWLLIRYVLRDNLLAYPLTFALIGLMQSGSTMLHNHRPDLQANAIAVFAAAIALVGWVAYRHPERSEVISDYVA